MAFWNKFPYTDFHELNLDWILQRIGLVDKARVDAEAAKDAAVTAQEGAEAAQAAALASENAARLSETRTEEIYNNLGETIAPQVTSWLNANVDPVGSAVTVDKSLTIEGSAADARFTGLRIKAVREFAENSDTLESLGYGYYKVTSFTADKVLQSSDGIIIDGTGSGNNFACMDYIAIPKGMIYFAFPFYSWNIVFYDDQLNVIDTINSDSNMSSIYGKSYNNENAAYYRVGGFHAGGFSEDVDQCFAYSYNDINAYHGYDRMIPLFRNTNLDPSSPSATTLTSDFIDADVPLIIESTDSSVYRYGVYLFDENDNNISTYYLNDIIGLKVSIPSGYRIKLYVRTPSQDNIVADESVLNTIIITRAINNIGVYTHAPGSLYLGPSAVRVGPVDKQYADTDILLHCNNFTDLTYNVFLYNIPDEYRVPDLFIYAEGEDFIIPAGMWYRFVVGPRVGTSTTLDVIKNVTLTKVTKNTPENKATVSDLGKTRLMADPDTVPAYYESHMTGKNATIRSRGQSAALQFAFITDYHYGTYNNSHTSRSLLSDIVMNSKVNTVINGGDTWTSGTSAIDIGEAKKRFINGVNETIPNAPCNWYFVLGNHDNGLDYLVQGDNVTTFGPYFTTKEVQEIMGGNLTMKDCTYDPKSTDLEYYFDHDNIRVIVLNNDLVTEGSSESQYSTLVFLCEALLSMGNKTAIIVTHKFCNNQGVRYNGASLIEEILVAYNARGTYTLATNQVARFGECTGHVCLVVSGHLHEDYSGSLSDGTPVVITTSANAGAGSEQGEDRTIGTVSENAIDVFSVDTTNRMIYVTRIGYGNDRSFAY